MARCAIELLSDENRLRRFGASARARAVQSYECDMIVPLYEAFYRRLVEGKLDKPKK